MTEYELRCIHDSRKSFYKKAFVIEEEGIIKLKSYETIVCIIENDKPIVYGTYSNTTLRHIKEFLLQNGFKCESKTQILNDYSETEEEKEEKEKGMNGLLKGFLMLGDMTNKEESLKDKNDYKKRLIKVTFENKGLSFPEDWDTLTEEEKEKRLNQVQEIL